MFIQGIDDLGLQQIPNAKGLSFDPQNVDRKTTYYHSTLNDVQW
jgi:hypothetical protein